MVRRRRRRRRRKRRRRKLEPNEPQKLQSLNLGVSHIIQTFVLMNVPLMDSV
jgi:hypothetical protein